MVSYGRGDGSRLNGYGRRKWNNWIWDIHFKERERVMGYCIRDGEKILGILNAIRDRDQRTSGYGSVCLILRFISNTWMLIVLFAVCVFRLMTPRQTS